MVKHGGLGKGLDSLISAKAPRTEETPKTPDAIVKISLVEPNRSQPRKTFDDAALEELAQSIAIHGIIQPLIVVKKGERYQIVAGERRWRAAQKVGLKEVPVIIRNYTDEQVSEIALIENIQRQDLNPIEEAEAYERLINEYGIKQEELAKRLSKSRAVVANHLRLLKLPESVRAMVIEGKISEGHARAVLGAGSAAQQEKLARDIVIKSYSVRDAERIVKGGEAPAGKTLKTPEWKKEDAAFYKKFEDGLKETLGTKVAIKRESREKGRIVLEYYSLEELERLAEIFKKGSGSK